MFFGVTGRIPTSKTPEGGMRSLEFSLFVVFRFLLGIELISDTIDQLNTICVVQCVLWCGYNFC